MKVGEKAERTSKHVVVAGLLFVVVALVPILTVMMIELDLGHTSISLTRGASKLLEKKRGKARFDILKYSNIFNAWGYNSPLYNNKKGILFCWIAKNSCTLMKTFLLAVGLESNTTNSKLKNLNVSYETFKKNYGLSHDSRSIHNIGMSKTKSKKRYKEIAANRNIKKIVVIRDPLERLLSGYINKCLDYDMYTPFILKYCSNETKITNNPSFARFANIVIDNISSNVFLHDIGHFAPQITWCDLYNTFENYDYALYMSSNGYVDSFERMVDELNLTQIYNGWGPNKNQTLLDKKWLKNGSSRTARKSKNSEIERLKQYYTPKLARQVYMAYRIDYKVLKIPYPSWIDDDW